ncbi:25.3 kDa vesicle transport protein SEC22-1 [Musa acuminata AAA Group]|uniref:25.3 kDa vesicle transport protein SEC22-1 n=1 Tax=Musa acuminata AAA Group TaxID=214697 RepID=UPI0031E09906
MVKLTLVGRLRDGMPLSQTPAHLIEDNDAFLASYRQKAELVLREISAGALTKPKMTILVDHCCFHYLIGNGTCCIALCDAWYPRKLAFHYLQDLHEELEKVDNRIVESFLEPYSFTRFEYVIGNIRNRYLDTRTQANLYKLNSDRRNYVDIPTQEFSNILRNCQTSGTDVGTSATITHAQATIWSSHLLEVIALKWTPITILVMVAAILLWTGVVLNEYNTLTAW